MKHILLSVAAIALMTNSVFAISQHHIDLLTQQINNRNAQTASILANDPTLSDKHDAAIVNSNNARNINATNKINGTNNPHH